MPTVKTQTVSREQFYKSTDLGIYINPAQPGVGKTLGLIEYIRSNSKRKNPLKIGVFTNNHDHLTEIEKGIPRSLYRHLKGFTKLCPRKDEPDIKAKYNAYGSGITCEACDRKAGCQYHHQFKFLMEKDNDDNDEDEDIQVVLSPLEFLAYEPLISYVDQIFIDESVEKLNYYNIGVNWKDGNDMKNDIHQIGQKNDIDTELLDKQIGRASEIIFEFQFTILAKASLLITEKKSILENFNSATYLESEYVIQNDNYITRPVNIEPVINDELEKMIHTFNVNIKEYNEDLSLIIKKDDNNILIHHFINFPAQIKAIRKLASIYQGNKPVPVNINERIESSPVNVPKELQSTSYRKADGTYLISHIGKQYTSEKTKKLESQPNSWITFGIHMMHTIFELAETYPVKLLDSSFNETCFNKLYNESQNGKDKRIIVYYVEPLEIVRNPESHIYPIFTRRNKYLSNYSRSSRGIINGHDPNEECLRDIKDINYFGRQAKKEGKKVAVITYMDLEKYFIEPFGKKMVKHFRGFRGSNTQEGAGALIVYGTPFHPPKTFLLDYINTFHEFPKNTKAIRDTHDGFNGYEDKDLNEFFEWHIMEEQYQAIHRVRPLLKNKDIALHGKVPQRIIDNKECNVEEPQTFSSLQAKLLNTKNYYLKHPKEARQALIPNTDKFNLNWAQSLIQDGTLLTSRAYKWGLSSEDVEKIVMDAFKPIMNSVLRCDWSNKKPTISAVTKSVYKESRSAKRKKRGLKGYSQQEIYFAIALLEKQGSVFTE